MMLLLLLLLELPGLRLLEVPWLLLLLLELLLALHRVPARLTHVWLHSPLHLKSLCACRQERAALGGGAVQRGRGCACAQGGERRETGLMGRGRVSRGRRAGVDVFLDVGRRLGGGVGPDALLQRHRA
ncbi:hypothetical protein V8E36_008576 [Tilletia maclaganii]